MRALSASVVLSSIVLGGWMTGGASAQTANLDTPPPLANIPGMQAGGGEELPPGFIAQPGVNAPGLLVGITLGELYTDNLKLAANGKPRESSWITQIQPFIKAATSGPRFSGVVDYRLTGYVYPGNANANQLVQNLNAGGTLVILPQHFFLDGSALYGNQIINNALPSGGGTFFLDNNRANVGMAMLSPYWVQDLGRAGTMTLRYMRGRIVYNDHGIPGENSATVRGIPDITSNAVQFSLVSPKYETWGWNLGYNEQRLEPDSGQSFDFAVARAGITYQVNNNLSLLADGGKENKFLPDGTTEKLGSPFWDAGFEWDTARNQFRLTVGHRFFGRSYQLSWTHQAALLTTNVSYIEQPTSYNQQLMGLGIGATSLPALNVGSDFLPSLLDRQIYLSKRAQASATYTMPSSSLTATVYDEQRTYLRLDNQREHFKSANLAWRFNLGPFTTLTPTVSWQRYLLRTGQTRDTYYAQLELVHQLDAKNFGSLRLRHDTSDVFSPVPGAHGYRVNVVFLQWTHLF